MGFVDPGNGHKGDASLWNQVHTLLAGRWASPIDGVAAVGFQSLLLAVPATVVGWVLHAVAVMCGLRLSGRRDAQQHADYDDVPSEPIPERNLSHTPHPSNWG
jgi:hypothetical protein